MKFSFKNNDAAGMPGSSACCGEWHRDAQYIHPDEEKEKGLILQPEAVVGGEMMQIQCALLPSRHFEYVRGSHNRWDTEAELLVRKGAFCLQNDDCFKSKMMDFACKMMSFASKMMTVY